MQLNSPIAVPPDPLAGPRTIGTASDHVRIDPDNARIQYAGAARPTRRLHGIAFADTASHFVAANGAHQWVCKSGGITDIWWSFGPLPDWVDVTADLILRAAMYVGAALTSPNDVVRLVSHIHLQRGGAVPVADTGAAVDHGFDGGGGYVASTVAIVTLRTRGSGTFLPGDLITAGIQRNAAATEDTVSQDLVFCDTPWIEVTQKEVA